MRVWLVTALDADHKFVDQRRIEAAGQYAAETYAYEWAKRVGGDPLKTSIHEINATLKPDTGETPHD